MVETREIMVTTTLGNGLSCDPRTQRTVVTMQTKRHSTSLSAINRIPSRAGMNTTRRARLTFKYITPPMVITITTPEERIPEMGTNNADRFRFYPLKLVSKELSHLNMTESKTLCHDRDRDLFHDHDRDRDHGHGQDQLREAQKTGHEKNIKNTTQGQPKGTSETVLRSFPVSHRNKSQTGKILFNPLHPTDATKTQARETIISRRRQR